MSTSWSLLLPHPNPYNFSKSPQPDLPSANSSASSFASTLSGIGININMSARGKLRKQRSNIPNSPPKLQPLSFSAEPIVDLTLPPYRGSPPPSPSRSNRLQRKDRDRDRNVRALGNVNGRRSRRQNERVYSGTNIDDDDNDTDSLVSGRSTRPHTQLAQDQGCLRHNPNHHYHHTHSADTITPFSSSPAKLSKKRPPLPPSIYINAAPVASAYLQPGHSSSPLGSRSTPTLGTPSPLSESFEVLPPLPLYGLMSSTQPSRPPHVQNDCGHGRGTLGSNSSQTTTTTIAAHQSPSPPNQKRASLLLRTFSLRGVAGSRIRPPAANRAAANAGASVAASNVKHEEAPQPQTQPQQPDAYQPGSWADVAASSALPSSSSSYVSASSSPFVPPSDSDSACRSGSTSISLSISGHGASASASRSGPLTPSSLSTSGVISVPNSLPISSISDPISSVCPAPELKPEPNRASGPGSSTFMLTSTASQPAAPAPVPAADTAAAARPTRPALTPYTSSASSAESGVSPSSLLTPPTSVSSSASASLSRNTSISTSASTSTSSFARWNLKRWRGGSLGSRADVEATQEQLLLHEKEGENVRGLLVKRHSGSNSSSSTKLKGKDKSQTHSRNSSWGDVALSLLVNGSLGKEKDKGKGKEKEKDKGDEREKEKEKAKPVKKAKFTLGNESEVDLSSVTAFSKMTTKEPIPPVPPLPANLNVNLNLVPKLKSSTTTQPQPSSPITPPSPTASPPLSAPRPPLHRHEATISADGHVGRRRWTLANAMTDEGISDEGLVRELERMREVGEWARRRERERRSGDKAQGEGEGQDMQLNLDLEREEQEEMMVVWDMGREIWEKEAGGAGVVLHDSPHSETGLADGDNRKTDSFPLPSSSTSGPSPTTATITHITTSPSSSWLAAQRALLTCRELILTERHYLSLLLSLLAQHTATPPPPLMLHYAEVLARASAGVLEGMEKEPSVGGVARAFLEREEAVGVAYVGWCGVVGAWFGGVGDGQGYVKKKRSRTDYNGGDLDLDENANTGAGATGTSSPPVSPLKRTVSTWRKSMPTITSLGLDGGTMSIYGRRDREVEKERAKMRSGTMNGTGNGNVVSAAAPVPPVPVSVASPVVSSGIVWPSAGSGGSGGGSGGAGFGGARLGSTGNLKPPRKPPAVRDLAILPTQRVMRYVLLYRDLLAHTPHTSPSRVLVERAVEAACRIADKCDRAQGNAAFIVSGSGSGTGPATTAKNRDASKDANANANALLNPGANASTGGDSASSSRSSSRREVPHPHLTTRSPGSRASSPSGKTVSSTSTSGSASTGVTSVSGSGPGPYSSSEGDLLSKVGTVGTMTRTAATAAGAPTGFPTSSSLLSSSASPTVLKKPKKRRPSTPESAGARRVSGVSLMSLSGWGAGRRPSLNSGGVDEPVPMVVNVKATGADDLKMPVDSVGAPHVVRSPTVMESATAEEAGETAAATATAIATAI